MRPPERAATAAVTGPRLAADLTLDATTARLGLLLRDVAGGLAAYEARVLMEEATGLDRAGLLREAGRPLGESATRRLEAWLARRLQGEPFWRVLGTREFYGLAFAVTPAVLDPRPDTEAVVEAALEGVGDRRGDDLRVLDLGIGSGAILGALLHAWPRARGWGVDLSWSACRVAAGNFTALGLGDRAHVVTGRWAEALAGTFDVVVSNPPYIETAVIPTLDPAVRDHDPHLALDGGADGLTAYRAIVGALPDLLRPGGVAVLEVGAGQAVPVGRLLQAAGFARCTTRRDLGGIERAVTARS